MTDTVWLRGMPPLQRFEHKYFVRLDTGCWEWSASTFSESDYGQFYSEGRNWRAHVWAWEHFVGPRTPNLVLDHFLFPERCIGPSCVNPEHLREVTHRENTLRSESLTALRLAQSECVNGHPFDETNTYYRPGSHDRSCKTCTSARSQEWRARNPKTPEQKAAHAAKELARYHAKKASA